MYSPGAWTPLCIWWNEDLFCFLNSRYSTEPGFWQDGNLKVLGLWGKRHWGRADAELQRADGMLAWTPQIWIHIASAVKWEWESGLDGWDLFAFVSCFVESILHVYRAEDICCLQGSDSQFLLRCQNCRRQNWLSSRGQLTFPVMQQPPMLRLAVSLWLLCVALENLPKKRIFKKETTLCISNENRCWPQMPHLLQVSWILFRAVCKSSLAAFILN